MPTAIMPTTMITAMTIQPVNRVDGIETSKTAIPCGMWWSGGQTTCGTGSSKFALIASAG